MYSPLVAVSFDHPQTLTACTKNAKSSCFKCPQYNYAHKRTHIYSFSSMPHPTPSPYVIARKCKGYALVVTDFCFEILTGF